MKAKIHVVDERTFKERANDWKNRQKDNLSRAWYWTVDNKEVLIALAPAAIAVVAGSSKIVSSTIRNHAVNKEIRYHERTIYDRSLGRYVELRRKLSNSEALLIEERRNRGEGLMAILQDMHLLK